MQVDWQAEQNGADGAICLQGFGFCGVSMSKLLDNTEMKASPK